MRKDTLDPGLMTEQTRERLKKKLQELKRKVKENQTEAGATFESAQDWHDNGAYDMLVQALQVLVTQHDAVEARLRDVQIIQSRKDTSRVGIGNTVVVRYAGETDSEKFTILGIADTDTEASWISAASPLGYALLEKKVGETISIPPNIQVTLLQILAGEF